MDERTCCPHETEVHDDFGCAAWLGYYTPGAVGRCLCKTPRAVSASVPLRVDGTPAMQPERRRYSRVRPTAQRAILRLVG